MKIKRLRLQESSLDPSKNKPFVDYADDSFPHIVTISHWEGQVLVITWHGESCSDYIEMFRPYLQRYESW